MTPPRYEAARLGSNVAGPQRAVGAVRVRQPPTDCSDLAWQTSVERWESQSIARDKPSARWAEGGERCGLELFLADALCLEDADRMPAEPADAGSLVNAAL